MKVFNGTPHNIVLYSERDVILGENKKYYLADDSPAQKLVIEPNQALRVTYTQTSDSLDVNGFNVCIVKPTVQHIDPLPEGYDMYIVSVQYLLALRELNLDTSNVYTVGPTVLNKEDKIVGSLHLRQ